MRLFNFKLGEISGVGVADPKGTLRGLLVNQERYPGSIEDLIGEGKNALKEAGDLLATSPVLDADALQFEPPVKRPSKVLCVGLNYADHGSEVGQTLVDYPTIFSRFATGIVGHGVAMVRPKVSQQFDFEGELAVVIGTTARNVSQANALSHVAGYSIFNDGSLRDYQTRTSQWTMGKNFDRTAGFGPFLVTPDELPAGATGIRLRTRLNGEVVQDATTSEFLFDVPHLIALISEVMTLEPGDVIATGTPSGVGAARQPQLFMRDGDVCEVEIEGIGTLVNPIRDEGEARQMALGS